MPVKIAFKPVVATLAVVAAVAAGIAAAVVGSGAYDVAADTPHRQFVYDVLETAMQQSVRRQARAIDESTLRADVPTARGVACYRRHCLQCHGAPGIAPDPAALAMQPLPGPLSDAHRHWRAREIAWMVRHGVRMSAMPAWQGRLHDDDLDAVVVAVGALGRASPGQWQQWDATARGKSCPTVAEASRAGVRAATPAGDAAAIGSAVALAIAASASASAPSTSPSASAPSASASAPASPSASAPAPAPAPAPASARMSRPAEPIAIGADLRAAGRAALRRNACHGCHVIPGVVGSSRAVGPSLAGWGRRASIKGRWSNTPETLARWIADPQSMAPGSAMPTLDVTPQDARAMAAYLLTLY